MTANGSPAPSAPSAAIFTLADDGARWICAGGITFENAAVALSSARSLELPAAGVLDCDALHPVDSSAVAVLVALKRRAAAEGRTLSIVNATEALRTLTELYGVEEILLS